jgi:hypothetical protein
VPSAYYDPAQARYVGYTYYSVSIEPQRLPFFQSAYDSLAASAIIDTNGTGAEVGCVGHRCRTLRVRKRNTIKKIAFCAYFARDRGRFDEVSWVRRVVL